MRAGWISSHHNIFLRCDPLLLPGAAGAKQAAAGAMSDLSDFCDLLETFSGIDKNSTVSEAASLLSRTSEWKRIGDKRARRAVAAFINSLNSPPRPTSSRRGWLMVLQTAKLVMSRSLLQPMIRGKNTKYCLDRGEIETCDSGLIVVLILKWIG